MSRKKMNGGARRKMPAGYYSLSPSVRQTHRTGQKLIMRQRRKAEKLKRALFRQGCLRYEDLPRSMQKQAKVKQLHLQGLARKRLAKRLERGRKGYIVSEEVALGPHPSPPAVMPPMFRQGKVSTETRLTHSTCPRMLSGHRMPVPTPSTSRSVQGQFTGGTQITPPRHSAGGMPQGPVEAACPRTMSPSIISQPINSSECTSPQVASPGLHSAQPPPNCPQASAPLQLYEGTFSNRTPSSPVPTSPTDNMTADNPPLSDDCNSETSPPSPEVSASQMPHTQQATVPPQPSRVVTSGCEMEQLQALLMQISRLKDIKQDFLEDVRSLKELKREDLDEVDYLNERKEGLLKELNDMMVHKQVLYQEIKEMHEEKGRLLDRVLSFENGGVLKESIDKLKEERSDLKAQRELLYEDIKRLQEEKGSIEKEVSSLHEAGCRQQELEENVRKLNKEAEEKDNYIGHINARIINIGHILSNGPTAEEAQVLDSD